jgi:hypothetical protein
MDIILIKYSICVIALKPEGHSDDFLIGNIPNNCKTFRMGQKVSIT